MRPLPLFVPLLLTAACVSTNAALLDPTVRLAPICPEGVAMFTSSLFFTM